MAVLLEFDDDGIEERCLKSCAEVLETKASVDGDPFGLGRIHQRNPFEQGLERRLEFRRLEVRMTCEIPAGGFVAPEIRQFPDRDFRPFFLRPSPVVLPFDLQEGVAGIDIGAGAHLLPAEPLVVVVGEHPEAFGVEVHGVVGTDPGAVGDKDPIAGLRRIPENAQ